MPALALALQGGTDLEKHRDLLMVENEQLRQEMRHCEAELQELRAKPAAACTGCEHSQVGTGPGRSRRAPLLTVTPALHSDPCLRVCLSVCLTRVRALSPACRRVPSSATSCPSSSWR